jgi:hypothetical protein
VRAGEVWTTIHSREPAVQAIETGHTVTPKQAGDFVCQHGIVLESARGPLPSLAAFVAGEPIGGSWWVHPRAKDIFELARALRSSDAILVCRLVGGKVTLVHQRLWPSLVRSADRFATDALARLDEQHTAAGRHTLATTPFPAWVPADVIKQAELLSASAAWDTLRSCAPEAFAVMEDDAE